MPDPVPTIDLELSTSDLPDVVTRITAFALHHQYAFRQTLHPEPFTGIDLFPSPDTSIHIHLRPWTSHAQPAEPVIQWLPEAPQASPEMAALLQHLLERVIASKTH